MTARRDFLKVGATAVIQADPCRLAVEQARRLVRSGALGRVRYCRIGDPALMAATRAVAGCITEVDPDFEGAAFLGSRATLVVTSGGCRVYPETA